MTPEEAVDRLRIDLADPRLPNELPTLDEDSLWSDVELYSFLNEAQNEFARRTRCFPDSTSYTSSIVADDKFVTLDSKIIDLRVGYLQTAQLEVYPVKRSQLLMRYGTELRSDYSNDVTGSTWRTVSGTPQYAVTDMAPNQVRLVPFPSSSDTIEWEVYRLPTEFIVDDTDTFEVDEQWHLTLLVYAKYMAYLKQDAETVDLARASELLELWNTELDDRICPFYSKFQRGAGIIRGGGPY